MPASLQSHRPYWQLFQARKKSPITNGLLMAASTEIRINTNPIPSKRLEEFFKVLIAYSIGMYVVEEIFIGSEHSLETPALLWSERVVAILLTLEYFLRWYYSKNRLRYPLSFMALVDLAAFVPFYVGFFVPEGTLHLIRTLRVVRLLKFYRYSTGLQILALGFYRAREQLKALGFATFVLVFVSQGAMYECERYAQPDKFGSLDDAFWFACVTVTTVGYGDVFPVTGIGRFVAMITFVTGITLFGTFTAVMGSSCGRFEGRTGSAKGRRNHSDGRNRKGEK